MDQNTNQSNTQVYFGIVVIVDALGVSDYPIADCEKIINNFEELNFQKEEFLKLFNNEPSKPEWEGAQTLSNIMKNVKTSEFGDSTILAFPIEEKYSIENFVAIYLIAAHLCTVICQGLTFKVPFRGAISVGKFICNDKRFLGPAISDVADWYETTEWFGIIFSPTAQLWLSTLIEKNKNNPGGASLMTCFDNFICKYKIPLKSSLKETLISQINSDDFFVVAWPSFFHYASIVDKQDKDKEVFSGKWAFDLVLSDLPKPKGTELKFKNSIDFFNWYGTMKGIDS